MDMVNPLADHDDATRCLQAFNDVCQGIRSVIKPGSETLKEDGIKASKLRINNGYVVLHAWENGDRSLGYSETRSDLKVKWVAHTCGNAVIAGQSDTADIIHTRLLEMQTALKPFIREIKP